MDGSFATALLEASKASDILPVQVKSAEQRALQVLHRVRVGGVCAGAGSGSHAARDGLSARLISTSKLRRRGEVEVTAQVSIDSHAGRSTDTSHERPVGSLSAENAAFGPHALVTN